MYNVFQIANGVKALIDQYRDFNSAKVYAVSLSRIKDAVYYIVRDNGNPLVYPAIMTALTQPEQPPILELEPPAPEEEPESVEETAPVDEPEEKPRGRRRRIGPEETKAATTGPAEHKAFPATVTNIDESEGIVTAIVNVFGIIDDGDDIIHPGAFGKTLVERGSRIRVLNSHNARDILNVIGKQQGIREVTREELPASILAKYPQATGGLETITRYMLDDPTSSAVFKRIKGGLVDEYSIGFDIVQSDNEKVTDDSGKTKVVRNIRQVRLWEYSPVIWGMNPATASVSIKGIDGVIKEVDTVETEEQSTPLLAEWLTTDIMLHCQSILGGMKWFGLIDEIEHDLLMQLCNERIERIKTDMPMGLALRPLDGGMMMFAANGADDTKAGRVLSERNFSRIQQAADLLTEVLEAATPTEEQPEKSADEMPIEIPSVPEQLINDGPHDEPETAPTSEKVTEAGPRGDEAPSERRTELEARLSRLLVED
jgi:HK97 family phage prohead protease